MNDDTLTSLRAAGAMIGESNRVSWEELLAKAGSDGDLRFAIAKARREFVSSQVTATQCAKAMRHTLKCPEPARKKGEALLPRAEAVLDRKERDAGASTMAVSATGKLVAPHEVETLDEMLDETTPHKLGGETADVDEAELDAAAQQQADVLEQELETAVPTPTTKPQEALVPKAVPAVDFPAIAKQLGTFRVAELAKKARCAIETARAAVETMKGDGVIEREPPGHRKCPWRIRGAPGARSAPAGGVVASSAAKPPKAAPERTVKPAAARREPDPRPPVGNDLVEAPAFVGSLTDRFEHLLGSLVDAYTEHHDIAVRPSARRALLQAALAFIPAE